MVNILYLILAFICLVRCTEFCNTFEHAFNPSNICDSNMVEEKEFSSSIIQFDEFKDLFKETVVIIFTKIIKGS
ncbi:hypothetical protein P3W45_001316 [Vairimorpha bombi]